MATHQLTLFERTREDVLEDKVKELQNQMDRVRKNLFAKYTELMGLYLEQKSELDELKNTKLLLQ